MGRFLLGVGFGLAVWGGVCVLLPLQPDDESRPALPPVYVPLSSGPLVSGDLPGGLEVGGLPHAVDSDGWRRQRTRVVPLGEGDGDRIPAPAAGQLFPIPVN